MPHLAEIAAWLIGSKKAQLELAKSGVACLHCGDAKRICYRSIPDALNAKCEEADNSDHRECQIKMRPHSTCSGFDRETERCRYRNDIDECNRERQSGYTGEFGDLDKWPIGMQRDTKSVPTESAKQPAPCPLMQDPGTRSEECRLQISPRTKKICRRN